jgi:gluconate 2-dehydrogenase gamma chain
VITFISRRELLKRAGLIGVAAAVGPAALESAGGGEAALQSAAAARQPFANLTTDESRVLEAVVARLIPSDAIGPGAAEAHAARYIDRALGGGLASSREAYATGLAALDRYARSLHGRPFVELSGAEQDAALLNVEAGTAIGFTESAAFFALVRAHTIQGTFCDPFYGGNADFVGWDLIGYPGVRTIVTPDDQRLGADVSRNHKSAYDYEMFVKAIASTDAHEETKHGH